MRVVAAIAVALLGCGPGSRVGADAGGPLDAAARCAPPAELDAVDLLFVVDAPEVLSVDIDSFPPTPSLLPRMLLGDGVDPDRPIARTFDDLHIGVVTADVGSGGYDGWGCPDPVLGDDGLLVDTPRGGFVPNYECPARYAERFVSWQAGMDFDARWQEVDCRVDGPSTGEVCRARQPFEALRRAFTEHGEGDNAGFLRDDALLAILFLTAGDDCSPTDEGFWDPDDESLDSPRCARFPERLQPIEDTASMVASLSRCPEHVFVGVLGGVPEDTGCTDSPTVNEAALDCLLAAPSMQIRYRAEAEGLQEPACGNVMMQSVPSRRILELQRAVLRAGGGAAVTGRCEVFDNGHQLGLLARAIAEYGTHR